MTHLTARSSVQRLALAAWASIVFFGCGADDPDMRNAEVTTADAAAPATKEDAGSAVDCPTCKLTMKALAADSSRDSCGNGLDDDKDGKVDNDCPCEAGSTQRCFTGSGAEAGVGACKWGVQHCAGDASGEFRTWGACVEQTLPVKERCSDSVDNDCDGMVDEDCGECEDGSAMSCSNACGEGQRICRDGKYGECTAHKPGEELCNGVDDDCDGVVDDLVRACSNTCGSGLQRCTNGQWSNCSAKEPRSEQCNGIDDDCNGIVDDLDRACSSTCGSGLQRCANGQWGSCSAKEPRSEQCNGIDDDCDGTIDDLEDQDCSTTCGKGTRTCENGQWSSCSAPTPRTETCNLQDDDCDGDTDEGLDVEFTFENDCSNSRVFLVIGGCNVCAGSCNGNWVDPGASRSLRVEQGTCITVSAFARTSNGDACLDESGGEFVGETRKICADLCIDRTLHMEVTPSC